MSKAREERTLKGLAAKYGATVRKRFSRIHSLQRARRRCPACGSWRLRRQSAGVWKCQRCDFTLAGGAYDVGPA